MRVDYAKDGTLLINGIQIPITKLQSAEIYQRLFSLYLNAVGDEIQLTKQAKRVVDEAESILKGEQA